MQSSHTLALWARCQDCLLWFTLDADPVDAGTWQCPACGGEPDRLESRAQT